MDNNSWRAAQGQVAQGQGGAGEASAMPNTANAVATNDLDNVDWRTQLQAESRQRIVNKIMDTLMRHLPFSGQEGLGELKKIAVRFEEKIYTAAMSKSDYLRKIALKMLTMETKSQNPMANPNTSKNPPDPVGHSMQSQIHNQPLSMSEVSNQSQAWQKLLPQNMQNSISSAGVQNSAGLTSTLPAVCNLTQASMLNVVGQNSLQNMQNISNVAQNPVGNSMGQGIPSNVFANSQRQMAGRQQVVPQQQQQQSASSQLLYQQQLQQQCMKQKFQQGSIQQSLMQSHLQEQQQQQNLLQPAQIQTFQQAVMQLSVMQSPLSNLQPHQLSSVQQGSQPVLQQHSQSVMKQQQQQRQPESILHQQQTSMPQQQMLPTPQQGQQQLIGQQPNAKNIQQNQLIGQPNAIPDLQQQQQRLMGQQNNILNLQQQQLMGQQNNLSNMHQPQLGPQNSVSGLQQFQMLGSQSGNSGIPANQHSVHMLQQKVPVQQQMQHANLLSNQAQQSQTQQTQQQMMSQIQSQKGQLQHLQQQSNPVQRDMQQRLQTSGPLLQLQNVAEQQKQLFQSQRAIPEASSNCGLASLDSTAQTGNASGGDWQEEVYQKIKSMKEMYYMELNEMYVKIATKLQQHESLSQQTKNEQLEKLKLFKVMLERLVQFLRVNKDDIQLGHKEKLGSIEKQIINFLNSNRPRKPIPLQQGQHPQPHMQQSQPQAQISQMQPHENQMNSQMQSINVPSSVATMQQNNMSGLQHNSLSSVPAVSNAQPSMINAIQPASNSDGQSNALNSLLQVALSSLQQNPVSGPQPANSSSLTSQSGMNTLQSSLNSLQTNSTMLQNQHLKQQEPHMLQTQQLKQQFQLWQMQQQLMQQQQQLMQQQQQQQQQHQQTKEQQPAQLPGHNMSPLHQMTDSSDMKIRQYSFLFWLFVFLFFLYALLYLYF